MKLRAGITAVAVGCGLFALACEQSPTVPGAKFSEHVACIFVSGEINEVFMGVGVAPCAGGEFTFVGPVTGDLIGNTNSCISFPFAAGRAIRFVAARTINAVSGAFAGQSFDGTQEGMSVGQPDGSSNVTGHFTIESGATGTLAMKGSVVFPNAQFVYFGTICPL